MNLKYIGIGAAIIAIIMVPIFLLPSSNTSTKKSELPKSEITAFANEIPKISQSDSSKKITKTQIEPKETKNKSCQSSFLDKLTIQTEAKGRSGGGSRGGSAGGSTKSPSKSNLSGNDSATKTPTNNDNTASWYTPNGGNKDGSKTTPNGVPNDETGKAYNQQNPNNTANQNPNQGMQNNFGGGMFGGQNQGMGIWNFLALNSLFNNFGRNKTCTETTVTLYDYWVEDNTSKKYYFAKNLNTNSQNPNNFNDFPLGRNIQ